MRYRAPRTIWTRQSVNVELPMTDAGLRLIVLLGSLLPTFGDLWTYFKN